MKNEEFDDAVRKKLESINPAFSNSEIDKVFRHVKKNRGFIWKGLNGSWFIYALSAAAMISVTTWMVLRPSQNTIAVKQSVTSNIEHNNSKLASAPVADSIPENKQNEPKIQSKGNLINSALPVINNLASTIKAKPSAKIAPKSIAVEDGAPRGKTDKPISESSSVAAIKIDKIQNQEAETAISAVSPTVYLPETNTATKVQERIPDSKNEAVQSIADMAGTSIQSGRTTSKDSITQQASLALNTDISGNKAGIPDGQKSEFRIRPAVLFTISGQKTGIGLTGDILIGRHFGFSAGITYNWLKEIKFIDKKDMYGRWSPGMNPPIDHHLGNLDHVSDITIRSTLIQLPLAFNWYIPLKKSFVLRASAGTDLDIYLNQKLSFNHFIDSVRFENPHFKGQAKVVPFNTLFLGLGVEKRWSHLVFSAQPCYNLRIKDVFYKPKQSEFGIGVSVTYSIGK